jgi:hypothetical protein
MFHCFGSSQSVESLNKFHSRSNISTLQSSVLMQPGIISNVFHCFGSSQSIESMNKFHSRFNISTLQSAYELLIHWRDDVRQDS